MLRQLTFAALSIAILAVPAFAKKEPLQIAGVTCQTPPPLHCPDDKCPGELVIDQGNAVEPKTGRKFFLDFLCGWKPGKKVTFFLSLHGGGSYGNWQRHYFPIMDFKDKHNLVIATPNAPFRVWAPVDDEYLRNIVNLVYEQIGKDNIKAFWLVGHSQGGMTSNCLGKAEVFQYPKCKDGRVVADVVRIDKGHTEGLEPRVTEQLIKLMLSAKKQPCSIALQ